MNYRRETLGARLRERLPFSSIDRDPLVPQCGREIGTVRLYELKPLLLRSHIAHLRIVLRCGITLKRQLLFLELYPDDVDIRMALPAVGLRLEPCLRSCLRQSGRLEHEDNLSGLRNGDNELFAVDIGCRPHE